MDAGGTTRRGRAVGRVLGTFDATPLQFWVAVQPGAYLQLDDVVVTTRELPDDGEPVTDRRRGDPGAGPARGRDLRLRRLRHRRRHAAGAGAGGGRDHHHPGRAGDLRAAGAGRAGPPGQRRRSATVRSTSTGWSGGSRSASAATASRSTSTPTSSTARRGAHVSHLRHLRRGHEDELRHLAALLGVPLRRARRRRRDRQHPRAHLQRQGRGPALPRPPEHPARRGHPLGVRPARASTPAPSPTCASTRRRGPAT